MRKLWLLKRVTIHIRNMEREGYGNKAKDFIFTKDFTGKNR